MSDSIRNNETRKSERLRVGVLGCGPVGVIHAQAYLKDQRVEFVGMCDVDQARAKERTKKLGVPGYACAEELIEKGKPDLVSVVVRWSDFEKPLEACFEAGVNVFAEKPISFDPAVILRLTQLAERKGLRFGVDFNQRFTLPSQWFRRLRDEGEFGEMMYTLCQYNQACGNERFYRLREHMIHQFDLWRYHIGEVRSVTAQATRPKGARPEDKAEGVGGTLLFQEGALGVFVNGFPGVGGLCNYYELVGTRGRGYCENFVGRAIFRSNEGPARFQDPPWIGDGGEYWDSVGVHVNLIVEALLEGLPLPVPATEAFEAQCLCTAFTRAVESGRVVEVQGVREEILNEAEPHV